MGSKWVISPNTYIYLVYIYISIYLYMSIYIYISTKGFTHFRYILSVKPSSKVANKKSRRP